MNLPSVRYVWVKAIYSGDKAKKVRELADERIGYKILSDEHGSLVVAFKFPLTTALPHHLVEITDQKQINEWEKKKES